MSSLRSLLFAALSLYFCIVPVETSRFGGLPNCGERGNLHGSHCVCLPDFSGPSCNTYLGPTCSRHSDCSVLLKDDVNVGACVLGQCIALDNDSDNIKLSSLPALAVGMNLVAVSPTLNNRDGFLYNCNGCGTTTPDGSCVCDTGFSGDYCHLFQSTTCFTSDDCPVSGSRCFVGRCIRPVVPVKKHKMSHTSHKKSIVDGIDFSGLFSSMKDHHW